jgi:hypothetical protein
MLEKNFAMPENVSVSMRLRHFDWRNGPDPERTGHTPPIRKVSLKKKPTNISMHLRKRDLGTPQIPIQIRGLRAVFLHHGLDVGPLRSLMILLRSRSQCTKSIVVSGQC